MQRSLFNNPNQYRLPDTDDLRQLRVLSGITAVDVADELGRSNDTIRWWESGRTEPTLSDVKAFVQVVERRADSTSYSVPDIGELRELRVLMDISVRELADELDRDRDTIWRWESGRTEPDLSEAAAYLEVLRRECPPTVDAIASD